LEIWNANSSKQLYDDAGILLDDTEDRMDKFNQQVPAKRVKIIENLSGVANEGTLHNELPGRVNLNTHVGLKKMKKESVDLKQHTKLEGRTSRARFIVSLVRNNIN
jgi:hypothetical protein